MDKFFTKQQTEFLEESRKRRVFSFEENPGTVNRIYEILGFNVLSENRKQDLKRFARKDERNIRAIEAIKSWKEENGIIYNPEEIFSRGERIYSEIGRYKIKDFKSYLKNFLSNLDYLEANNFPLEVSAYTGDPKKLKTTGIRFEINPSPEDVVWASPVDVSSSRVQNSTKDLSRYPISFTKAPKTEDLARVSSNLADVVEERGKKNNELAIKVKRGNFRIIYDDNIEPEIKNIIDGINSKIEFSEPSITNKKIGPQKKSPNNIIEIYNKVQKVDTTQVENKYYKIYTRANSEQVLIAKKIYSEYLQELEVSLGEVDPCSEKTLDGFKDFIKKRFDFKNKLN